MSNSTSISGRGAVASTHLRRVLLIGTALTGVVAADRALAQATNWTSTDTEVQNWFDPANWSNGVPTNNTVNITDATTTNSSPTIFGGAATAGTVNVDNGNSLNIAGAAASLAAGAFNLGGTTGENQLNIVSGGSATLGLLTVGANAGTGTSTVSVSGSTASLSFSSGSTIGANGTGQLTISDGGSVNAGGLLNVGANGTLAFTGTGGTLTATGVALQGAASNITFGQSGTVTLSAAVSGAGLVNVTGTGTTILTGANTYSGATTISSGTLQIGNGGSTGTLGSGNVVNNGTLAFNRDTITVSNAISGTGAVNVLGGTTILTGANTYSGATTIASGTLQVGNGGSTGTLGTGNVVNNGTLIINRDLVNISNVISGTGSVGIQGGSTTLSGANTYSGNTAVASGATLSLANNSAAGTGFIELQGATLDYQNFPGNLSIANAVHLDASSTLNVASGVSTQSGVISTTGGVQTDLTKTGSGTLILTGNNTYAGNTTVSAGVLQIGNGGTSGTLGTGSVINNATVDFNRSGTVTVANDILGSGDVRISGPGTTIFTGANSYSGGTTINAGSTLQAGIGGTAGFFGVGNVANNGTLAVNRSDGITYSGVISGTGSVTNAGSGTFLLTGNNTYTGTTTISNGFIQVGNGSNTGSLGTGNVVNNGGLLFNRIDAVTVANTISGTGAVGIQGAGVTTLTGANTYSGGTTVDAGTLRLGANSAAGTGLIQLDGGNLSYANGVNIANVVQLKNTTNGFEVRDGEIATQTGSIVTTPGFTATDFYKTGDGTLVLAGATSYRGGTFITAGALRAGAANVFNATSAYSVNASARLDIGGFAQTIGSLTGLAGSVVTNTGSAATLTTGADNTSTSFAGVISGSGANALGLTKTGSGVFTLTGVNTYTGATTINGGALTIGSGGQLAGSGSSHSAVTNNATLTVNSGAIVRASTLTNNAGSTINNAGSILGDGASINNSGVMSTTGTLVDATDINNLAGGVLNASGILSAPLVTNAGTIRLTGNLTGSNSGGAPYAGPITTFSNAGTLDLTQGTLSGVTTFNNAGTVLALNGNFVNATTFNNNSGGVISLQNGAVTDSRTISNAYNSNGGAVAVDVNLNATSGVRADQFILAGAASGNTALRLANVGGGRAFFTTPLLIATAPSSATFSLSNDATTQAAVNGGLISYSFQNFAPNQWGLVANLDTSSSATPSTNLASTLLSLNTGFFQDATPYVTAPKGAAANSWTGGLWVRTSAGSNTISSVSTSTAGATANAKTALNYNGWQMGADGALANVGGSGVNLHFGAFAGDANGSARDKINPGSADMSMPFFGAYMAATGGGLFFNAQWRHDNLRMKVTNTTLGLSSAAQRASGDSFSATTGYRFEVGAFYVEPTTGLIVSRHRPTDLTLGGGAGTLQFDTVRSTLGRVGARTGMNVALDGGYTLNPFVSAFVWREFAGNAMTQFVAPGGTATISTSRVGTFVKLSSGLEVESPNKMVTGYVRGDLRTGANIHGWSGTAGMRVNF